MTTTRLKNNASGKKISMTQELLTMLVKMIRENGLEGGSMYDTFISLGETFKDDFNLTYTISANDYESEEPYIVSNNVVKLNDVEELNYFFEDYIMNDVNMRWKDYLNNPEDKDTMTMKWNIVRNW